jgi:hypothetical protein
MHCFDGLSPVLFAGLGLYSVICSRHRRGEDAACHDDAQWKQLHAVIRAARRDASQTRTVRLSTSAHALLHQRAAREHLTLSAVIERYLSEAATPLATQAIPTKAKKPRARRAEGAGAKVVAQAVFEPPPRKVMQVTLWLVVENNNKFVRGKKKARETIEDLVLSRYGMPRAQRGGPAYTLSIPYEIDEELDEIVSDILREADNAADDRHCFIEADVQSLEEPDRSW